jgi:predicted nucleic acid-binding protein
LIFVVDASFVIEHLFSGAKPFLEKRPGASVNFAAPYLIDAEVGQVLRRYFLNHTLNERSLNDAAQLYSSFRLMRYEHLPLVPRSLQLKDNITFYDALYVSLAEALDVTLLTRDERLRTAIRDVSAVRTGDSIA